MPSASTTSDAARDQLGAVLGAAHHLEHAAAGADRRRSTASERRRADPRSPASSSCETPGPDVEGQQQRTLERRRRTRRPRRRARRRAATRMRRPAPRGWHPTIRGRRPATRAVRPRRCRGPGRRRRARQRRRRAPEPAEGRGRWSGGCRARAPRTRWRRGGRGQRDAVVQGLGHRELLWGWSTTWAHHGIPQVSVRRVAG